MSGSRVGLIFHGIGEPMRELEPGEAPYWIDRDLFASVLDRVCALPDPGRVRISFDDGNLSDRQIGLPMLAERGLTADFFVLTGRIGQAGSLGIADIRALLDAGMGIGSHGIAHRAWNGLNDAELEDELVRSRHVLEEMCGTPVQSAGIPFGAYDARVLRALRSAGYMAAYSSDGGCMDPTAFLRPRASVRAGMDMAEIDALIAGRMSLRRRLRRIIGMARKRFL
jgi:peptidoglycan/xylan/chitin deacetylase (PgdA/CDA1 family)